MASAALIGIDWGTSSFRAFLLDAAGAVLDRRAGPHGILAVENGGFAEVLAAQTGGWLESRRLPVVMSGMIGSRQGWIEAPYLTTPVSLTDIAAALVPVAFERADVRIVAGIESAGATMRDVMRGEETQVFGALETLGIGDGRFLLPGTHSKWVQAEEGRIIGLSTYMTGEIYSACRAHTILGRLMTDGGDSPEAFGRGVREGAGAGGPGALLNRLFGVRTAGLFGEIEGAGLSSYLSGILIGAEMADQAGRDPRPVHVIASDSLAERYRHAAQQLGIAAEALSSDCVARGHVAIARLAGLVGEP